MPRLRTDEWRPDVKKVGVAHAVGQHAGHADQVAAQPAEGHVLRLFERPPQCGS
jgi:hypothetical protein